jgi:hypothetical protein
LNIRCCDVATTFTAAWANKATRIKHVDTKAKLMPVTIYEPGTGYFYDRTLKTKAN